jgi:ribulose 1,5-bisphosphate synthetase/thiazole synthase
MTDQRRGAATVEAFVASPSQLRRLEESDDMKTYDVVVIGAGAVGENAAWYATDNGMTAALVERELVGGECSYWGVYAEQVTAAPR